MPKNINDVTEPMKIRPPLKYAFDWFKHVIADGEYDIIFASDKKYIITPTARIVYCTLFRNFPRFINNKYI